MSDGTAPESGGEAPDLTAASESGRSLLQRALDVVLYAPAGAVLQMTEEFPAMAAKGRDRLEMQIENARIVGRFVVGQGRQDLTRRIDRLPVPARRRDIQATGVDIENTTPDEQPVEPDEGTLEPLAPSEARAQPTATAAGGEPPRAHQGATGEVVALPSDRASTAAADAAIEGYDTLSASQVVRRLDGLGTEELRAVYRHEAATRGRRTILHRAQQLLGVAGAPESG